MRGDKRERAARALCRHAGNPENIIFEGRPMWMSYLSEADAVLRAIQDHPMDGQGFVPQPGPDEAPELLRRPDAQRSRQPR